MQIIFYNYENKSHLIFRKRLLNVVFQTEEFTKKKPYIYCCYQQGFFPKTVIDSIKFSRVNTYNTFLGGILGFEFFFPQRLQYVHYLGLFFFYHLTTKYVFSLLNWFTFICHSIIFCDVKSDVARAESIHTHDVLFLKEIQIDI